MRSSRRFRVSFLVCAVVGLAAACGGDEATPETSRPKSDGGTNPGPSVDGGQGIVADSSVPCTGSPTFRCSADGMTRTKCASGVRTDEACPRGCLRNEATDSVCMGSTSTWSCTGTYGTERAQDGDYYITAFGCWVDEQGVKHGDAGDNCIPGCLSKLQAAGVCPKTDTGKACEERINWFTADAARFQCGTKVRIENPKNGKKVVAIAIDQGPSCTVEKKASKAALDASGRVNRYLFGVDHGIVDKALVHVVEVDDATPLGPVP